MDIKIKVELKYIENIKENILILQEKYKKTVDGERNLLNKWFQDSVKNYILEATAGPLLMKYLNLSSIQDVKVFIHSRLEKTYPKYIAVMDAYCSMISESQQTEEFCNKLLEIIHQATEPLITVSDKVNYVVEKGLRKRFVCLMILQFLKFRKTMEMSSFYDIWNSCFPQEIQSKKISKFDFLRRYSQEKQEESQSNTLDQNGSYEEIHSNKQEVSSDVSISGCQSPDVSQIQQQQNLEYLPEMEQSNIEVAQIPVETNSFEESLLLVKRQQQELHIPLDFGLDNSFEAYQEHQFSNKNNKEQNFYHLTPVHLGDSGHVLPISEFTSHFYLDPLFKRSESRSFSSYFPEQQHHDSGYCFSQEITFFDPQDLDYYEQSGL